MSYGIPGYIQVSFVNQFVYLKNDFTDRTVQLEFQYLDDVKRLLEFDDANVNQELLKFLKENWMVIEDNQFKEIIDEYYDFENQMLNIIIFATEQCNFRCKYCYEEFKDGKMTDVQYDKIFAFIIHKINIQKIQSLNISWFGGEPLLQSDDVIQFTKEVNVLCDSKNISFSSNITTNGYYLTNDVFQQLYDTGVKMYQITIDGSFQDQLRVLINGGKTKQVILENIRIILESNQQDVKIILRNNILKDNEDYAWYDEIVKQFLLDKRIYIHVHPVSPLGGKNKLNMMIEKDVIDKTLVKHLNYINSVGLQVYQENQRSMCYASSKGSYAFRPNGEIVSCTVALNDKRNVIGSFKEEALINENQHSFWTNKVNDMKCSTCRSFISCEMNRCPKKKLEVSNCHYLKNEIKNIKKFN